jgi:L-2-hydroxyglutarate oxidase LhgO
MFDAERIDCIVIGAGVVGLAVARALALEGRETLVIESEAVAGSGISSRNSGVIHAGIYYPPGSMKARLCVRGCSLLYDYCLARSVEHRRCGKLILATDDSQLALLAALADNARESGVENLEILTGPQTRSLEPAVHAVAALLSPSTGIVDSHGLQVALTADLEALGGRVVVRCPFRRGAPMKGGIRLEVGAEEPFEIVAATVINCAGLGAQAIASRIDGIPRETIPPQFLAKGHYFSLRGAAPFHRLVYPVPEAGGLGVHFTLDLAGRARFGPDVEWIDELDYGVDPARAERFYEAIRRYWPRVPTGALLPDYAGIRPKLAGRGMPAADFLIQDARTHGIPGLVNLYGIESPGLTACLALAEHVAGLLAAGP